MLQDHRLFALVLTLVALRILSLLASWEIHSVEAVRDLRGVKDCH